MHKGIIITLPALIFSLWPLQLPAVMDASSPKTRELTCSAKKSIGDEIRKLQPGDTLLVSGVCYENLVLSEEFHNITLDGQELATINGPDPSLSTIIVRGTGITIRGFTITGGSNGVLVNRGGRARIDGNTIDGVGSNGINVNQNSAAIIVNNMIQNNPGDGIIVNENSAARIGFQSTDEIVASANMIQNNGERGINLIRSSNARIVGNIISNNTEDGVFVNRSSQADVSSNEINGNGGNGIFVTRNSGVNLGSDSGDGIFDASNITSANNTVNGIRCRINSYVDGRRGSLTGNGGATNFNDGTCVDSTNP